MPTKSVARPHGTRLRAPRWKLLAPYVLLLVLIGGDYLLLAQALVLLNRSSSAAGSITVVTYVVTTVVSAAMVAVPHFIAQNERRISERLRPTFWRWMTIALGLVWIVLVVVITTARIRSGLNAETTSALSGLEGGTVTETPSFDPLAPESLMAFLTAAALCVTGMVSFAIAWHEYRPTTHEHLRFLDDHHEAVHDADAAEAELVLAHETLSNALDLDRQDAVALKAARGVATANIRRIRADVTTLIMQHVADPDASSQVIRELEALRLARTNRSFDQDADGEQVVAPPSTATSGDADRSPRGATAGERPMDGVPEAADPTLQAAR